MKAPFRVCGHGHITRTRIAEGLTRLVCSCGWCAVEIGPGVGA